LPSFTALFSKHGSQDLVSPNIDIDWHGFFLLPPC